MSYPNWVFSMFAFIGFVMAAIPFPWHLEAWNTGTCLYMMWTALGCLFQFINSIAWNSHTRDIAPVWCDITSKFIIGSAVGIPVASLCINRRLYIIATSNSVTVTKAEKRRSVMIDLAIGLGIPILEMVLHVIPQGHRYNIIEQVGCYPSTYITPVALVLVTIWPIIIGLVSAVYCFLAIRNFNKRRAQFNELLSSHSNLSSHRYFRLMALAGTEILLTVPLASFGLWLTVVKDGVHPWLGWADTHFNFNRADMFPAFVWQDGGYAEMSLEVTRWTIIMCAMIFFVFFGFADEARKHYRSYITIVAKRAGFSTGSMSGTLNSSNASGSKWNMGGIVSSSGRGTLPVFVTKDIRRKRDSFDSFTDMSTSGSFTSGDMKEKSLGMLSLADIGGTLDYNPSPISSGSSDRSSIVSETPSYPHSPTDDDDIEISSIRRVSSVPRVPEAAFLSGAPRHAVDTTSPV